jgi:hypothetical protein
MLQTKLTPEPNEFQIAPLLWKSPVNGFVNAVFSYSSVEGFRMFVTEQSV